MTDPARSIRTALLAVAEAQRVQADALEALAAALGEQTGEQPRDALDDLLNVRQTAELLGMSDSWVYRAVEEGRLPSVRLGSRVRFRRDDIAAFVARRACGTLVGPGNGPSERS